MYDSRTSRKRGVKAVDKEAAGLPYRSKKAKPKYSAKQLAALERLRQGPIELTCKLGFLSNKEGWSQATLDGLVGKRVATMNWVTPQLLRYTIKRGV